MFAFTKRKQPYLKPSWLEYLSTHRYILAGIFIFIISFAPYLKTLSYPFVWDDSPLAGSYYTALTPVFKPFTHGYLMRFTRGLEFDYYRPVSALSFMLDNRIWGFDPFGYHFTNLVMHASVCLFVYLAVLKWFKSLKAALIAGLLFCFHPAHNEAAVWISGRCDLLVAFFLLPAYLLFSVRERIRAAFILTPLLYMLALLSKEGALVFIPILIADDWANHRKWSYQRVIRDYLPLLLATVLCLGGRWLATGRVSAGNVFMQSFVDTVTDFPANVAVYLKMITWPHNVCPFQMRKNIAPEHLAYWFAGIVILAYLAVRLANAARRTLFLLAWLLLPLILVSGIIPFMSQYLCTRFTYFATVALCAMYGAAGAWIIDRVRFAFGKALVGLVVVGLIASFGFYNVTSTGAWASNRDVNLTIQRGNFLR